jgi:long-chain acyl-CoA synthetase
MNKPWTKTYGPGVPLEIDADTYSSTVALFDSAVAKYADHPAFECFGRTMTYAEVDRASRALACQPARKRDPQSASKRDPFECWSGCAV